MYTERRLTSEDMKDSFSLSRIVINFFTGFGSGLIGTAIFGIMILLTWSIVGDTLSPSDIRLNEFGVQISQTDSHPLFLHFITLAIFLGILAGNIAFVILNTVVEDRYEHRSTAITHVFFANLIILILMLPGYVTMSNLFGSEGIAFAGVSHAILSVLFSFFALEFIHFTKYLFVSLYGALMGIVLFLLIGSFLVKGNTSLLAFLSLPLLMGLVLAGNGIVRAIYAWMYQTYGMDVLNIQTRFGDDYSDKKSTD